MGIKVKIRHSNGSFGPVFLVEEDYMTDIDFGFGSSGLCRLSLEDDVLVIDPWNYGEAVSKNDLYEKALEAGERLRSGESISF